MPKSLVIVESPAKAKTIGRYLGNDYTVKASMGHIKDLPKSKLGIHVDNGFVLEYHVIPGKEKVLRELKSAAKSFKDIYLAADPDREGEAICQHLAEELGGKDRAFHRVLLNEITKSAVLKAINNPAEIDEKLVNAQQARRALDRLVGYKVSPLLWDKVRTGLSAGRVQTVALRLIVDREGEIRSFKSQEFWTITAHLHAKKPPVFDAKAIKLNGEKFDVDNEAQATEICTTLEKSQFVVDSVVTKEKKRYPVPPFITSKLQQEAARRLRFSVKRTMMIAQRLYEGVEIGGEGSVGLITYMRTDAPRVSQEALQEVRSYIRERHGEPFIPPDPIHYKSKKGAQDAHEAIRPTSALRTPDSLRDYLDKDEWRLYDLIWKRFVASQMTPAVFDHTDVEITAGPCIFKASGSVPKFQGFLAVYQESQEENGEKVEVNEEDKEIKLPPLSPGDRLKVLKITPEQNFTQPPSRYSEAMLVKALEDRGIGRPSTYASILSVITNREYAHKVEGRFVPTETGEVVTELLVESFRELFDYEYTARMEEHLDRIEEGQEHWVDAMRAFYKDFSKSLAVAAKEMRDVKREEIETDEVCEKCGQKMVIKWGKFGRFLACSGYPDCVNTREIQKESTPEDPNPKSGLEEETCENCGKPMVLKRGRFGEFLACSGYPECKTTKRLVRQGQERIVKEEVKLDETCPQCGKQLVLKHGRFGEFTACSNYPACKYIKHKTTGVKCPKPDCDGEIIERKSRRGKVFFGCNRYPKCDFVLWNRPLDETCPKCKSPYLVFKVSKKEGPMKYCNNEACDYKAPAAESEPALSPA